MTVQPKGNEMCSCACHELEENHSPEDCYCMNDKLQNSFDRWIDEQGGLLTE